MNDKIEDNAYSALFRRVEGSIFSDGYFTYRQSRIYLQELEEDDVLDLERLKKRLLKTIIQMNNDRVEHYNIERSLIYETTPFEIKKFNILKQGEKGYSGHYSLYPLEFICDKCGKYYRVLNTKSLSDVPHTCSCGGKVKQNTIALFCPKCGTLNPMRLNCTKHGTHSIYVKRPKVDNISTWMWGCKECGDLTRKIYFQCPACKGRMEPLTIRDGGLVNPVVKTYVDLLKLKVKTDSDIIRYAIDSRKIDISVLSKILGIELTPTDLEITIAEVENQASYKVLQPSQAILDAKKYIDAVKESIKNEFSSDETLESINDVQSILSNSISLLSIIDSLDTELSYAILSMLDEFQLFDIYYIKELRLISSCIGKINGINKFYDSDYIPHFEPFKIKQDEATIYAVVNPMITEGIMFKLKVESVCSWLYKNGFISEEIPKDQQELYIQHLSPNSIEFEKINVLLHSFSHALIKQSSVHTGLDEGTCSELLFVNCCSFLIYSTSTVNTGGFEYLFKYSLVDWFSEIKAAVEGCTLDPMCSEDGGRCFSCMYLQEHVCTEFNQNLSRHSLIGGGTYQFGLWGYRRVLND